MLSIIIVNYKTFELTKQTLQSTFVQKVDFDYEVILVDNNSQDGSVEKLEYVFYEEIKSQKLKIIKNKINGGFAQGNNLGIKHSQGKYILLLNSDTILRENVLYKCINFAEKYHLKTGTPIGALGAKVLLEDGTLDHACKRGFPTPKASLNYMLKLDKINPQKYGQYRALYRSEDSVGEVECLTGAFMLIPKKIIDEVGLLDEEYFMYAEDIDWCYRIKQAGYKIIYYPRATITHLKGGSSKKRRPKLIYHFYATMWLFYKKHYYKEYPIWINVLVFIGIIIRYLLAICINFTKKVTD